MKDEGEGIPEKDLPHIFERFYRVDKSRTRATGGSGLGLAIVKEIIELHRGSISVKVNWVTGLSLLFFLKVKYFPNERLVNNLTGLSL